MLVALTRAVSPNLDRCELTHLAREPIDVELARVQHRDYEAALQDLGCVVQRVPPAPDLPDAVFIEDTAVVLDELAVLTRPGAASRRPETAALSAVLGAYRRVVLIEPPGTLEGGDVLRVGQTVYVGRSARTNAAGIAQLARLLRPHGYGVRAVEVRDCLHLKTAVTEVADATVLLNPTWVDQAVFADLNVLEVDPEEPFAANALRIDDAVVHASAWTRTRQRLEACGIRVVPVDASEIAKAEGGVTCCSVIVRD